MARIRPTFPESFVPKKSEARTEKTYYDFLSQLPCVVTGREGVQICHLSFSRPELGHFGRGRGTKVASRWCLPMTPECHERQHSGSEAAFWDEVGVSPHLTALVLYGLYSEFGDDGLEMARKIILERRLK